MVILSIPVRKVQVKVDGAVEELHQLVDGFVAVRGKDAVLEKLSGGQTKISNPLQEAFLNWDDLGTGEDVFIKLIELPGFEVVGENGPSISGHSLSKPV